jgi:glucokinase
MNIPSSTPAPPPPQMMAIQNIAHHIWRGGASRALASAPSPKCAFHLGEGQGGGKERQYRRAKIARTSLGGGNSTSPISALERGERRYRSSLGVGGKPILLGFDIGGTKTAAVLGTPAGEILARAEAPTPAESFEAAFQEMVALADRLLASESVHPQAVSAAVGGPLDIERGIIYAPPHLPTWVNAPLKDRLAEHYGLPVYIEHDGNAGALAEWYFGAGRGTQNMIYLTAGTGLGAGIILNGRIYRGSTDTAGEIGHMRIAEDGPLEYGKAGSWEGYCSGAGMLKLARLRQPQRWGEETTTRDLVSLALAGDTDAVELVAEMGNWLGKGLAILVDVLNPQAIVIGTLGVVLGDLLLAPAREVLKQEALPVAAHACRVVPAELGDHLSSLGALMAAIDAYR